MDRIEKPRQDKRPHNGRQKWGENRKYQVQQKNDKEDKERSRENFYRLSHANNVLLEVVGCAGWSNCRELLCRASLLETPFIG